MTKRILLTLLLLGICLPCYAQDYYVYIRTYDRSGVTKDDDKGRSKKGDIVDIRVADYSLSDAEKKEWLILKVPDLTPEEIADYKSERKEQKGIDERGQPIFETKAYRKNKIDFSTISLKEGLIETKQNSTLFKSRISEKTTLDLVRYEQERSFNQKPLVRFAKRRIDNICRFMLPYAWGSTVVSTINKTGQDYDTLTLWEDAKDGDLVTATTIQEADCYNDDGTLVEGGISIDGSTTSSSYYMYVTSPAGERHTGTAGTGFVIDPSTTVGNGGSVILANDLNTIIEWIEVKGWVGSSFGGESYGIDCGYDMLAIIRRNIVHNADTPGSDANPYGISGGRQNYVVNNIVYTVGTGISVGAQYGGGGRCSNNTVYNFDFDNDGRVGISLAYVVTAKNNLVIQGTYSSACYSYGGTGGTLSNNGGSDTTGDIDNMTFADLFVSSSDLHLKAGADAIDVGTDLGTTDGVQFDIDNYDRDTTGVTWDIGADEYVSAVSSYGAKLYQGSVKLLGSVSN